MHLALPAWVAVSTLGALAGGVFGTAAAVLYLVVILVVWSPWLHHYGVNPGSIAVTVVLAAVRGVRYLFRKRPAAPHVPLPLPPSRLIPLRSPAMANESKLVVDRAATG